MTHAIVLREYGGPEKLEWSEVTVGRPAPDELRIRHTAIGVNFHDTYVRTGLYRTLTPPGIPGLEAAGVVEDVGSDIKGFVAGDRIVYIDETYGAYAEARLLPARRAIRLPAGVSDQAAAALAVKGMTACMLLRHVYRVARGETLLIHAAAGAVGQNLVRWAKHLGARVIGTVGTPEKGALASECGADDIILYRRENFVERVRELTGGQGVKVVYDAVGADTFAGSLDCLDYCGTLVNFGQASGPVAPIEVSRLAVRSLTLVRPLLFHYIRTRAALEEMAAETFRMLAEGVLIARVGLALPLARAAEAHAALEARRTSGATVLLP
jgi:NADPH2:quinone reductase